MLNKEDKMVCGVLHVYFLSLPFLSFQGGHRKETRKI